MVAVAAWGGGGRTSNSWQATAADERFVLIAMQLRGPRTTVDVVVWCCGRVARAYGRSQASAAVVRRAVWTAPVCGRCVWGCWASQCVHPGLCRGHGTVVTGQGRGRRVDDTVMHTCTVCFSLAALCATCALIHSLHCNCAVPPSLVSAYAAAMGAQGGAYVLRTCCTWVCRAGG